MYPKHIFLLFKAMTPKQKYGCRLLSERLHEPLCPLSYFNLNKSAYLGMVGTVLTYIIVLMQFKVGTLGEQKNGDNSVCNATVTSSNNTVINATR